MEAARPNEIKEWRGGTMEFLETAAASPGPGNIISARFGDGCVRVALLRKPICNATWEHSSPHLSVAILLNPVEGGKGVLRGSRGREGEGRI